MQGRSNIVQGRLQNIIHCFISGIAPFFDIRTGELKDNRRVSYLTWTSLSVLKRS